MSSEESKQKRKKVPACNDIVMCVRVYRYLQVYVHEFMQLGYDTHM